MSKKFRDEHPPIRGKLMIGMRDKPIHHYFGVDLDEVRKTVRDDLPELKLLFETEGLR
ncbi:MAG: HepT-like ribonuclease domain-containing protein [Candidatus Methanogasteraceae archaeon]